MDRLLIGADIAKETFEVAVGGPGGEVDWGKYDNTPAGFGRLADRLAQAQAKWDAASAPVLLVLEPTGGYELARQPAQPEAGARLGQEPGAPGQDRPPRCASVGRLRRQPATGALATLAGGAERVG